jgi:hypothetical protein
MRLAPRGLGDRITNASVSVNRHAYASQREAITVFHGCLPAFNGFKRLFNGFITKHQALSTKHQAPALRGKHQARGFAAAFPYYLNPIPCTLSLIPYT